MSPSSPIWKSPQPVIPVACVVVAVRVPAVASDQVPDLRAIRNTEVSAPPSTSPARKVNVAL